MLTVTHYVIKTSLTDKYCIPIPVWNYPECSEGNEKKKDTNKQKNTSIVQLKKEEKKNLNVGKHAMLVKIVLKGKIHFGQQAMLIQQTGKINIFE